MEYRFNETIKEYKNRELYGKSIVFNDIYKVFTNLNR